MQDPFRYFNSSPEVVRLAVMMYVRYSLSLRQVEDLLFERGIDICHETPGSQGRAEVLEAHNEALRPTAINRNGPASIVPVGDEGYRQCCRPSLRALTR